MSIGVGDFLPRTNLTRKRCKHYKNHDQTSCQRSIDRRRRFRWYKQLLEGKYFQFVSFRSYFRSNSSERDACDEFRLKNCKTRDERRNRRRATRLEKSSESRCRENERESVRIERVVDSIVKNKIRIYTFSTDMISSFVIERGWKHHDANNKVSTPAYALP